MSYMYVGTRINEMEQVDVIQSKTGEDVSRMDATDFDPTICIKSEIEEVDELLFQDAFVEQALSTESNMFLDESAVKTEVIVKEENQTVKCAGRYIVPEKLSEILSTVSGYQNDNAIKEEPCEAAPTKQNGLVGGRNKRKQAITTLEDPQVQLEVFQYSERYIVPETLTEVLAVDNTNCDMKEEPPSVQLESIVTIEKSPGGERRRRKTALAPLEDLDEPSQFMKTENSEFVSKSTPGVSVSLQSIKREIPEESQETGASDLRLDTPISHCISDESSGLENVNQVKSRRKQVLTPKKDPLEDNSKIFATDHFPKSLRFSCKHCGAMTAEEMEMFEHMRCHKRERKYRCLICNETFNQQHKLSCHMQASHPSERPYKCNKCNKTFRLPASVVGHMRIHRRKQALTPSDVKRQKATKLLAKDNQRNHFQKLEFKCTVCPKNFQLFSELTDHSSSHTEGPPFKCVVCAKKFSNFANLLLHMGSHPGSKPFKCKFCDERFLSQYQVSVHEHYSHGRNKSLKCTVCWKSFDSTQKLKLHSYLHTGERPYKCCFCKASFISFKLLSTHARSAHSKNKEHKCIMCFENFSQAHLLIRHMYGKKAHCGVCKKALNFPCLLTKHMLTHKK